MEIIQSPLQAHRYNAAADRAKTSSFPFVCICKMKNKSKNHVPKGAELVVWCQRVSESLRNSRLSMLSKTIFFFVQRILLIARLATAPADRRWSSSVGDINNEINGLIPSKLRISIRLVSSFAAQFIKAPTAFWFRAHNREISGFRPPSFRISIWLTSATVWAITRWQSIDH